MVQLHKSLIQSCNRNGETTKNTMMCIVTETGKGNGKVGMTIVSIIMEINTMVIMGNSIMQRITTEIIIINMVKEVGNITMEKTITKGVNTITEDMDTNMEVIHCSRLKRKIHIVFYQVVDTIKITMDIIKNMDIMENMENTVMEVMATEDTVMVNLIYDFLVCLATFKCVNLFKFR